MTSEIYLLERRLRREKRRTLFLYNLQIQRRISYTKRQRTRLMQLGIGEKTVLSGVLSRLERLGCRLRWCCVCVGRGRGVTGPWSAQSQLRLTVPSAGGTWAGPVTPVSPLVTGNQRRAVQTQTCTMSIRATT
ncbi:hypothetical protein J4Q44_G00392100 [Coregonus suidteri]|uniref:Uncharacterized protein n=1 Tax=Coregonus suidteri TaxID=861788 RepID=A0AAN8Q8N6_9TELE